MTKFFSLAVAALLAGGCARTTQPQPLSSDHPASIDAEASFLPEPSNTLSQKEPVGPSNTQAGNEAHQHGGHGGMQHNMTPAPAEQSGATTQPHAAYVCPMHPEVTSDKPGKCPKCGMKLVKNEEGTEGGNAHGGH
jgi:hypothetical protein